MLAMKLQQNEWEERHGGCESEGVEKPRADAADSPQPARPRRLISCDCTDMDCTFTAPFRWPVAGLQSLITAQRGDPRRAFDFRERYAPFNFHHSPLLQGGDTWRADRRTQDERPLGTSCCGSRIAGMSWSALFGATNPYGPHR
jgi:hypothetical protein